MPLSNFGTGRYVASESDVLWVPKAYTGGGLIRGVVYVHGAGELASQPLNPGAVTTKQNEAKLLSAIAAVYPMISFDCGVFGSGGPADSNNWGNANGQTRLGQAITFLQTALGANGMRNPAGGGAKTGKVLLVGISMGHALSLNYAQANPANVAAIVGILPVNDLDDIRDNDRGAAGYQQGIGTAWATGTQTARTSGTTSGSATVTDAACVAGDLGRYVTGPGIPINTFVGTVTAGVSYLLSSSPSSQINVNATATNAAAALFLTNRWTAAGTPALPGTANPAKTANQTNLIAIPQKNWAANDDLICTIATAQALSTNIGANCVLVNMGNTGGHSDASVGAVPIADVLAFLAAHA